MDPDPPWIEELFNSNHPPSDQSAHEVRKLLLKPLKDLEDLDSQIHELRNRLSELEGKRNEAQKQISRYRSIFAHIRRVPPDVLGEIFYHCLPTHRNPIMKSNDCPLLLTRVCSIWRDTALSTPKLWDRLHITFANYDTVPALETFVVMARDGQGLVGRENVNMWHYCQSQADKQHTTELLRRRCEAAKEWILRSGTRPLSLSVHFTTADWYPVPYSDRTPGATTELLFLLASLAPRWKKFEVEAPFEIYKELEDMLPPLSQMTTLTSFKAKCANCYHLPIRPPGLKLLDAPNLQQISMWMGYSLSWDNRQSFTRWDQLTHISCSSSFSDEDTIFLFQHAVNLVYYQGFLNQWSDRIENRAYEGLVSLPFLRSLSLSECDIPQISNRIFALIDAPKLQRFEYDNTFDDGSFLLQFHRPVPIPILPLLQKSTELENLTLKICHLHFWDVGPVLRAVPSVTDLVIGEARPIAVNHPVPYIYYTISAILQWNLWSFSDLILDNSDTILLPRLNSLVLASGTISISDDTLFDLIKSRIKSSQTASLTRIKAYLYRERQRNIVDELTAYAESVGVNIDLDFAYAQKHPSVHPTSPDFGLVEIPNGFDEWS